MNIVRAQPNSSYFRYHSIVGKSIKVLLSIIFLYRKVHSNIFFYYGIYIYSKKLWSIRGF